MFKSVQKAVYSVRNKPVCEFKNWCVTTLLQGYVTYPVYCLQQPIAQINSPFRNKKGTGPRKLLQRLLGLLLGTGKKIGQ